jgi:tetratricopeptide (TPR) repeat protein
MAALLAAIERGTESPRRRLWTMGAALGIAALAVMGLGALRWRGRDPGVCAHAEDRLTGAWDDGRKSQLRAAFLATGAPYAGAAWAGTEALLDRYAGSWVQMHTETCEATQVRGEQSGELLDLRMACLSQRREGLRALTSLLAAADREVVGRATQAAAQLASLEECASRQALTEPLRLPQDPAARARIEAARGELAEAAAELSAGHHERSRALGSKAVDEARALSYKPLEAEALMAVATAHVRMEDAASAEPLLYRALVAAQASGHLMIAARANLSLAFVHGLMLRRHPQGHVWVDLAEATIARIGDPPLVSAQHLVVRGNLVLDEGHAGEALPCFEQALALQERALGPEHFEVSRTLGRLASTLAPLERYPEAIAAAQRSLAINERLFGPDHTELTNSLHALAFILFQSGRSAEGVPLMERALAIQERAFGPDHPALVKTLINLSNMHQDPGEAVTFLLRAREIQERKVGVEHPDMVFILKNLAISYGLLHRHEEQLAHAQRALPLEEKLLGSDHPELVETLAVLAQAHEKLGEPARALPLLERALAIAGSRPLTDAYSIGRGPRVELQGQLADLLWSMKRDRKRARALVASALELSRGGGDEAAKDVTKLETWLSEHPL